MTKTVEQLRKELQAAEERERKEHEARHDSVKPVWQYTILPSDGRGYDKLWDDSVVYYVLSGNLLNVDELKAVGWSEHELARGSMRYLYNTISGRLVCSTGGGYLYIHSWYDQDSVAERVAVDKVSRFLVEHPEGGDITSIVNEFRESMRRER